MKTRLLGGLGNTFANGTSHHQDMRVYSVGDTSTTLAIKNNPLYLVAMRGRYKNGSKQTKQQLEIQKSGLSNTLTGVQKDNLVMNKEEYRIRKLTPKECWRLMDFTDEQFNKAAEVNSNTQLYKQAGNSIVVNVLVAILGQLFKGKENVYKENINESRERA